MKTKSFMIVIILLAVMLIGCGTNTQTIVQVVVTATPETSSFCSEDDVSAYFDGLDPLVELSIGEVDSTNEAIENDNWDDVLLHIAKQEEYDNDIVRYTATANPPECLVKINEYRGLASLYFASSAHKYLNGDTVGWDNDVTKGMNYLQMMIDELEKFRNNNPNG